jgi:hypothetical protein
MIAENITSLVLSNLDFKIPCGDKIEKKLIDLTSQCPNLVNLELGSVFSFHGFNQKLVRKFFKSFKGIKS